MPALSVYEFVLKANGSDEAGAVNAKRYGLKGNGSDDTAAFLQMKSAANAMPSDTVALHFPGGEYRIDSSALQFGNGDKQFIFVGDSPRASRIVIGGSDDRAMSFGADFNSWAGLRNIRVTSSASRECALYVKNPANAFILDRAFIGAGGLADYCVHIDGGAGVGLHALWTYTTGALKTNWRATSLTSDQLVVISDGNSDVGGEGVLSVEAPTASGGSFVFMGGRWEGVAGKALFQFNTESTSWLRVIASAFIGQPAASIVKKIAGGRPFWYLDGRFQTKPANIYTDVENGANDIAAVAADLYAPILDPLAS